MERPVSLMSRSVMSAVGALLLLASPSARGITPIVLYQDLVAGNGVPDLRDGSFTGASFASPAGLAVSPDGKTLYVADSGNHAIRAIHLDEANRVSTVTGQRTPGFRDGILAEALFNLPGFIACVSNTQLVVEDRQNKRLRLIDIRKGQVTTLAGPNGKALKSDGQDVMADGELGSLVFHPSKNAVLFSQPMAHAIRSIDMDTFSIKDVVSNEPLVTEPGALSLAGKQLYVADQRTRKIHRFVWKPDGKDYSRTEIGEVSDVLALAADGESLYAFRNNLSAPWHRVFPDPGPITLVSTFGRPLQGSHPPNLFFATNPPVDRIGLAPDPGIPHRFFLTNPHVNSILAVRDLRQDSIGMGPSAVFLSPSGLRDFDYPPAKGPGVYRIILYGRSYVYYSPDGICAETSDHFLSSMCKKLEILLNLESSLRDRQVRFEVFNGGNVFDLPLNVAFYHEAPAIVNKFNIDLVLLFQDPGISIASFLQYPLGKDGIPQEERDMEYMLKPLKEKEFTAEIDSLLTYCRRRKMVIQETEREIAINENDVAGDPEGRDLLLRIVGRPISLTLDRFSGSGVGRRTKPRFAMLYHPLMGPDPKLEVKRAFYRDLAVRYRIPWIDLTDEIVATRATFYPSSEYESTQHFNPEGHSLIAYLILRHLIRDIKIPGFE